MTHRLPGDAADVLAAYALGLMLAVLGSCPLAASPHEGATPAQARESKLLLMHYMPWYETPAVRGRWGAHWTGHEGQHDPGRLGPDGLPDLWSHYHPLIGPYDSADPDALECHLLQMKLAGIDGVIADWYGISGTADYPPIHHATQRLFEATGRLGMQFAACFEDRTVQLQVERGALDPEQVPGHLAETFGWMKAHWFDAPQHVRIGGRPLVLNFGPVFVTDPSAWGGALGAVAPRPAFFALHHLWRKAGADGGFTWVHYDAWEGEPDAATLRRRLHETFARTSADPAGVIVSAVPGFRDVYADPHPVLDHRGGRTLCESLGAAMDGPWPIVQLVTWNDYGEGTMIEPTHEFGYRFLEIIQKARRDERGAAFAFSADDLRLPARLYALRKTPGIAAEALDRVSALLRDGEVADADEAMKQLGG